MKTTAWSLRAAALTAAIVIQMTTPASARDAVYPPDRDHPLYVAHMFVAPVGNALDWAIFRPLSRLHQRVSPYEHITTRGYTGCSKERPARGCTYVVK